MTRWTRSRLAIRLSSSSLRRLPRHASVSASSATSRPTLFLEPEAVRDRAGDAVDPHDLSLDAMLLDANVEHCRRDVDDPKRWS